MAEGTAEAPLENGGGGDSGAGALERGVAPIKRQYLTTKEQFHQFLEAKGQEKTCRETEVGDPAGNELAEPEAKRIRLEDGQTADGQTEEAAEPGEQLQTQKRARGQNKGRPHVKPTNYDKNRTWCRRSWRPAGPSPRPSATAWTKPCSSSCGSARSASSELSRPCAGSARAPHPLPLSPRARQPRALPGRKTVVPSRSPQGRALAPLPAAPCGPAGP
ncbi:dihydrouridine synthase 3 like [Homo sapiens]|uniref:Dihydrouridine synthase 3 like n=1 Tax=Homo sapiens TaxID=9606 RepID=K7EJX8_HUMAN|nr:dihydrouridine synthase 3 like [Homo sapiens]KAI4039812.1 dihydrouridine synthase 3 like [Homo sapiens]